MNNIRDFGSGQLYVGDCRESLKLMKEQGVKAQMCVTSPPYWALRSYIADDSSDKVYELGLEPTPEAYVQNMVEVFRLVRDVLADDGIAWVNLGDSYVGSGVRTTEHANPGISRSAFRDGPGGRQVPQTKNPKAKLLQFGPNRRGQVGLKPKDLVGIPWMIAFALRNDGWWLRSDIVWEKPSCMPEAVKDRPTRCHEYIFLLAKNQHYFYDNEAIKEPASEDTHARYARGRSDKHKYVDGGPGNQTPAKSLDHMRKPGVNPKAAINHPNSRQNPSFSHTVKDMVELRNRRSVWSVNNTGYSGAHFACYPPDLIRPCILAGSRAGDTVLDPFLGSGTTAMVAESLGRRWLGCELQPDYEPLIRKRLAQPSLLGDMVG